MDDLSQMRWNREKLFLFPYYPKDSELANEVTDQILHFKQNRAFAVQRVIQLAIKAFEQAEDDFRESYCCRYLVALPPHEAGQRNRPCETVCAALANHFSWLQHLPGALERIETVPKSSTARKEGRERTDYETHLRSIAYAGPPIHASGQGIILIDDIYTNGATSDACYGILKDMTGCDYILGFFVGKTQRHFQRR